MGKQSYQDRLRKEADEIVKEISLSYLSFKGMEDFIWLRLMRAFHEGELAGLNDARTILKSGLEKKSEEKSNEPF